MLCITLVEILDRSTIVCGPASVLVVKAKHPEPIQNNPVMSFSTASEMASTAVPWYSSSLATSPHYAFHDPTPLSDSKFEESQCLISYTPTVPTYQHFLEFDNVLPFSRFLYLLMFWPGGFVHGFYFLPALVPCVLQVIFYKSHLRGFLFTPYPISEPLL